MVVLNALISFQKRDAFVIADPFVDEIIGERLSQGTEADEKWFYAQKRLKF